jgi:pyruvate dehydrogenase E1 component
MNENYEHPNMPEGCQDGIIKGLYCFKAHTQKTPKLEVQLMGSGTVLREVIEAAKILEADYQVSANIWSAPSFNLLARDGLAADRWNLLHPAEKPKIPYITSCFADNKGPIIAATDYMKAYAEQVRGFIPRRYVVLGTDGFGRSDTRAALREFFEVNRHYIVLAALKALADEGSIPMKTVIEAQQKYKIDPEKPNPLTV